MTSLKEQIEKLPREAKSQYYKLTTRDVATINDFRVSQSDFEILQLFLDNCKVFDGDGICENSAVLNLNVALVNHSCVPNADLGS